MVRQWLIGRVAIAALTGCGRLGFGTDAVDAGSVDGLDGDVPDALDVRTTVALNGGSSWEGWTFIADSQTTGFWIIGDTGRTYNFYRTRFILDATQTVTAASLPDGTPGDGTSIVGDSQNLFTNSWQVGDRVVGIGLSYTGTTTANRVFFQVDYDGNTLLPATSVGAIDGQANFDAGDSASYFTSAVGERFREYHYAVFNGFTDGGDNFTFIYGAPPPASPSGPSRSLAILANGSMTEATSAQFLLNLDALNRIGGGTGSGEGTCNANTRLAFNEGLGPSESHQVFPFGACF